MLHVPGYIAWVFGAAVVGALAAFYQASRGSIRVLGGLLAWAGLQSALGLAGFYLQTTSVPPRPGLLLGPPLLALAALVGTRRGQRFLDSMYLPALTWLHVVRVPVELVLWWLYQRGMVPELLTFAGRNFDVLAGLSAPWVYYYGYGVARPRLGPTAVLSWNLLALGLVLNVAVHGVLAVPGPLQQIGFEQPNVAVLHFPFVLLPALLVPLVILAHLAALRQLGRMLFHSRT